MSDDETVPASSVQRRAPDSSGEAPPVIAITALPPSGDAVRIGKSSATSATADEAASARSHCSAPDSVVKSPGASVMPWRSAAATISGGGGAAALWTRRATPTPS